MKILTFGRSGVFVLVCMLSLIPVLSYAYVYNCAYSTSNGVCGTNGALRINMVVNPPINYGPRLSASNFAVYVHSSNGGAPITFQASEGGNTINLVGAYTVDTPSMLGYAPSYSPGCSGIISDYQQAMCSITMSPIVGYSAQQNTQLPYQYQYAPVLRGPLTCTAVNQTAIVGQAVRFVAQGGTNVYSWVVLDGNYQASGSELDVSFNNPGVQFARVTSGAEVTTCRVSVVGQATPPGHMYVPTYTTDPTYGQYTQLTQYVAPASHPLPPANLVSHYVPTLPNTGLEPKTALQLALALIALVAVGVLMTPYIRRVVRAIK